MVCITLFKKNIIYNILSCPLPFLPLWLSGLQLELRRLDTKYGTCSPQKELHVRLLY